jgi:hypothetical protein
MKEAAFEAIFESIVNDVLELDKKYTHQKHSDEEPNVDYEEIVITESESENECEKCEKSSSKKSGSSGSS